MKRRPGMSSPIEIIKPLNSQAYREPCIRNEVATAKAKHVQKSRLKVQKNSPAEKLVAGENGNDGLVAEFGPSSVCLAKMVRCFIEESGSNRSSNCFYRKRNDSFYDEFDTCSGFGSPADSLDTLKSLIPCASLAEKNLLANTWKIVEKNKTRVPKDDLRKIVTDGLLFLGHDASICKSRWKRSPSIPAGEYEYIDVIVEGGERLLIDINFRSHFEIGRPTGGYKSILQSLPHIFVGRADRLDHIISIVSEAARQSLLMKGMDFPLWRKAEYMRSKWFSPHSRTTAEAAVQEEEESLSGYLKLIFCEETSSWEEIGAVGSATLSPVENSGEEKKYTWQPPAIEQKSCERGTKSGMSKIFDGLLPSYMDERTIVLTPNYNNMDLEICRDLREHKLFPEVRMKPETCYPESCWESMELKHPVTLEELRMDRENKGINSDFLGFVRDKQLCKNQWMNGKLNCLVYDSPSCIITAMANYLKFGINHLDVTSSSSFAELEYPLLTTRKCFEGLFHFARLLLNLKTDEFAVHDLLSKIDTLFNLRHNNERIFVFTTNHRDQHDAASLLPVGMDIYIHKSSSQPIALPDGGKRTYHDSLIVSNTEKENTGEAYDSTKRNSLQDFDAAKKKVVKLFTRRGSDCSYSVELEQPPTFVELEKDPENEGLISDLLSFVRDKELHKRMGQTWKRGYLLYDSPGTDRSSLIAAMANCVEFDVYDLDLAGLSSMRELYLALSKIQNHSLIAIKNFDNWFERHPNLMNEIPFLRNGNELTLSSLFGIICSYLPFKSEQIIVLTINLNHRDRFLVSNSKKESTRETSKSLCVTESVLSPDDSMSTISLANFVIDALDYRADLVRSYQSAIMFALENKDTREGLNKECLSKSVLSDDDSTKRELSRGCMSLAFSGLTHEESDGFSDFVDSDSDDFDDFDNGAKRIPNFKDEFVDGSLPNCEDEWITVSTTNHRDLNDAALLPLVNMDIDIHTALPQPIALPDGGEIVQLKGKEKLMQSGMSKIFDGLLPSYMDERMIVLTPNYNNMDSDICRELRECKLLPEVRMKPETCYPESGWESMELKHPVTLEELRMDRENKGINSDFLGFVRDKQLCTNQWMNEKLNCLEYDSTSCIITAMANYLKFGINHLDVTSSSSFAELEYPLLTTRKCFEGLFHFASLLLNLKTDEFAVHDLLSKIDALFNLRQNNERIFVFTTNHRDQHDAASLLPVGMDIYIHKSSSQPIALPDGGKRTYHDSLIVSNIEKENTGDAYDSTKRNSLQDFNATKNKVVKLFTRRGSDCSYSVELEQPPTFVELEKNPENEGLISDLLSFVRDKELHKRMGQTWKRGYLLYESPGTDRSSLISAMANCVKFDVYDLDLAGLSSMRELYLALSKIQNHSLIAIKNFDNWFDRHPNLMNEIPFLRNGNELTLSSLFGIICLYLPFNSEQIIVLTINLNHRDRFLVSNSKKESTRETSKSLCMTESVLSPDDSMSTISLANFVIDALDYRADLVRSYQSPIMFALESKDTREGLNKECLSKSVLGDDDSTKRELSRGCMSLAFLGLTHEESDGFSDFVDSDSDNFDDFDNGAKRFPNFKDEFVDGSLPNCEDEWITVSTTNHRDLNDAALLPLVNMDIDIHTALPQPTALPDGGEIVQLESSEQKSLVDFDATNNRAYQSSVLVSSQKKNTIEAYKGRWESLIQRTKKDMGDRLNKESLTKSALGLDDFTEQNSVDPRKGGGRLHSMEHDQPVTFAELGTDPENEGIVSDLLRFGREKEFYKSVGKAWKRGYLLYDPSCIDRSNLMAYMAKHLEFEIYNLDLTDLSSIEELKNVLVSVRNRSLIVVKDFDQWFRRLPNLKNELTGSYLLEFVDGLLSRCGGEQIMVFTTNSRDLHDAALRHPLNDVIAHAAKADLCSTAVSLPKKKKVKKSLKRKCRAMSLVLEDHRQHFGRRCEGTATSLGVTPICMKHGINRVSSVNRIHEPHGIHWSPFRQKWARRKGYSLGGERTFEVSNVSMDDILDSRLLFIHMPQFARSSLQTLAIPDGGKSVGPVALSSSKLAATNNRAHDVRQDQNGYTTSLYECKRTRVTSGRQGIAMSLCSVKDLQQHLGCKHKVVMKRLGVNRPMFKSTFRQHQIYWRPCRFKNNVGRIIEIFSSSERKAFDATNKRAHLVEADRSGPTVSNLEKETTREASKRKCITKSVLISEDLRQHYAGGQRDAAKRLCDSFVRNSVEVLDVLPLWEESNTIEHLVPRRRLALQQCWIRPKKSLDLPRTLQMNCTGGLNVQSASSLHWPIGLPAGGDVVSLSKKIIVRKTFKRECRTLSVSFECHQQHFGSRCEGVVNSPCENRVYEQHGISLVPTVKRIHRQRGIHWSPFRQGNSFGRERPVEVISVSTEEKLISSLQFLRMSLLGRSSLRPLALPSGSEFPGQMAFSSSELTTTNNRAHRGRQDQCGSSASRIEKERTREALYREGIASHVFSFEHVQQHFGSKRENDAKILGVCLSTLKRITRDHGICRWPNQIRNNVWRSPDPRREKNLLPMFKALSTTSPITMENDMGCQNPEPNELLPDSFEDLNFWNGENGSLPEIEKTPAFHDSFSGNCCDADICLSEYDKTETAGGSFRWAFQLKGLTTQFTANPNLNTLVFPHPQIASTEVLSESMGSSEVRTKLLASQAEGFLESAIGLTDGEHIPSLSEKKIVRKALKRKCRNMSIISSEEHQQHVGRRWEDDAKFLGVKRICRRLVIHRESTAKLIHWQHGICRLPFKQSAISLPDGGHILPLSKKKIARKTLNRKCRTVGILSLEYHQHVDSRCEDVVNGLGTKRVCRQLVIHLVCMAKRIRTQHGIHWWPFQQNWATMKGYSLGDTRPAEVISLSMDGKLVSRLQLIHISWLGRFSPRPSAVTGGGESVGPIALSASEFVGTNNRADRVGQDQSGSTSSHSKKKRTREQEDHRQINKSITLNDLQQHYDRKREDASESLGVSISTLKRICRQHGIERWPYEPRNKAVKKPPDKHGGMNTSETCKTLSTNGSNPASSQPMLTMSHTGGSSEDQRNLLASQEEPFLQGHVSRPINGTISSCTDPTPSQPVPTVPHTTGSLEDQRNLLALPGESLPSQLMPTIPPTMDGLEHWNDWSAFLDDPIPEGHASGSIDCTVPSCCGPAPSQPMPTIAHTMPAIPLMMPLLTERQDTGSMKLKATYGDTTIKLRLPPSFGISELKEEVSKRRESGLGSYKIEYKDVDGIWTWIACNDDIRDYLELLASLGNQVIQLRVRDIPNTPICCQFCGSLNK